MNIYAVRTSEKWLDLYKGERAPKVTVTTITRKVDAYECYAIKAVKVTGKYWNTCGYQGCGLSIPFGACKKVTQKWIRYMTE